MAGVTAGVATRQREGDSQGGNQDRHLQNVAASGLRPANVLAHNPRSCALSVRPARAAGLMRLLDSSSVSLLPENGEWRVAPIDGHHFPLVAVRPPSDNNLARAESRGEIVATADSHTDKGHLSGDCPDVRAVRRGKRVEDPGRSRSVDGTGCLRLRLTGNGTLRSVEVRVQVDARPDPFRSGISVGAPCRST